MPFKINEFKGAFSLEGARATLFEAAIFSQLGSAAKDFRFHCKAAQLPGKTLGMIEVPYFGRKIKVHGDLTFAEWTVTVFNEENFSVRNAFEEWMSDINAHNANTQKKSPYKTNAKVVQYTKFGDIVKTYKFTGIWCSDIAAIDVDWGSNDQIEEFAVTLQYDWWESDTTDEPSGGDDVVSA